MQVECNLYLKQYAYFSGKGKSCKPNFDIKFKLLFKTITDMYPYSLITYLIVYTAFT